MSDIVFGGRSDIWSTNLGCASVGTPDIRPPPQTISYTYRLQKFPLFLSSSYRLQKFADTDRLRVNRRPIRKDFFPDRYDFVPIVFTSSSCKRGLSLHYTVTCQPNDTLLYLIG